MQYFVSGDSGASSQGLLPFGLVIALACLSSFGGMTRFLFSDEPSVERLVEYQSQKLFEAAENPISLRAATLYVHSITEHCQGRQLELWESWPQWLLGQFYSPLLRTQNPLWIVSGGRGDCSERSAVLQDLLACQGIPSRFVGLGGHVVLEAKSDEETWILDPDYGLSIQSGLEELLGQGEGELAAWLVDQGIVPSKSLEYERMVRTVQDNVALGWNQPLSPRLKSIESLCELGVWVVPLLCWLGIGWNILPGNRR